MPYSNSAEGRTDKVARHVITWTSDGSGNYSETVSGINGTILRVTFAPDTVAAPDANHDVKFMDPFGIDVLMDSGLNLPSAEPRTTTPYHGGSIIPLVVADDLTLVVANAGANKSGKLIVYTR